MRFWIPLQAWLSEKYRPFYIIEARRLASKLPRKARTAGEVDSFSSTDSTFEHLLQTWKCHADHFGFTNPRAFHSLVQVFPVSECFFREIGGAHVTELEVIRPCKVLVAAGSYSKTGKANQDRTCFTCSLAWHASLVCVCLIARALLHP